MAKQDSWVRVTLRIPSDLHARLSEAASAKSLNALIVETLEREFPEPTPLDDYLADLEEIVLKEKAFLEELPDGPEKQALRERLSLRAGRVSEVLQRIEDQIEGKLRVARKEEEVDDG